MHAWRRRRAGLPVAVLLVVLTGCGQADDDSPIRDNASGPDTTNGQIQLSTTSVAFQVAQGDSLAGETRSVTATHNGDYVLVGVETELPCGPLDPRGCLNADYRTHWRANPVQVAILGETPPITLPPGTYTAIFRFSAMSGVTVLGYQDVTVTLTVI